MSQEFDERNLFLQVALGLLSFGGRFAALLDRVAPVRGEERQDEEVLQPAEPIVALVLGAIAIQDRLQQRLDAAVAAPTTVFPAESDTPPGLAADALRRWLR